MQTLSKSLCLLVLLLALPLRAQFIDTFTTSDPSNYNEVLAYAATGSSGIPPTFAINGSGQLQPTGGTSETTIWLRNTGATLSDTIFHQSVSLTLVNVSPVTGAAAIGFSNSLTPTSKTPGSGYSSQDFELGIVATGGHYYVSASNIATFGNATLLLGVDFSLGSITDTVTRLGDNSFSYLFTGPGLTSTTNASGTFTVSGSIANGHALYFGPDIYGGTNAGSQIVDNIQYVPEPSTYALMAAGVGFLVLLGRRTIRRS